MVTLPENRPTSTCSTGDVVLYHYTNFYGLSGIVGSKSLWCSKIQYLNDSAELQHGYEILLMASSRLISECPALELLADAVEQLSRINVFVASLSEKGDLLSQWRGYAGGSGVSIAFSWEQLQRKATDNGYRLVKCIYNDGEKLRIAEEYLREQIDLAGPSPSHHFNWTIAAKFLPYASMFKDPSFFEEQEWRLVSPPMATNILTRPTSSGLVPYTIFDLVDATVDHKSNSGEQLTDICISEVKIGPNREQRLQMDSLGMLFRQHKVRARNTSLSSVPYRQL